MADQHHHEHHHEHDEHCCCGHGEHHHEHEHHHHEHEHDHHHDECCCHDDGCGCGHDHGHADAAHGRKLLWRVAAAIVLAGAGFLTQDWIRAALFVLAYLSAGYDVVWHAGRNILRGKIFDENFLMTVASLGAMLMGDFAEGVAVMALYQVGEYFQDKAVDKSRASIAELMDIRPDYANLLQADGSAERVDPEDVPVGAKILVKPGERIPLDGLVLAGASSLDTRALTGESLPRSVQAGDSVISGCVNETAALTVQVTTAFHDSTVSKILELVEHSGQSKARTERFISRFARIYTPLVCLAALLLAVIPSLFDGQWLRWIHQALSFLVISCPCALVISVPLTFFSGIGAASRQGILIKGANHLENLARLNTVVFDKTGTLTQGVFAVTEIHPVQGDENALLETATLAECWSDHPIGRSLQAAWGKAADPQQIAESEAIAGRGVRAKIGGRMVYAGNARLMAEIGIQVSDSAAGTTVHVAADGTYLGYIVLGDVLKPHAAQAMTELQACGIERLVMLTGDSKDVAEHVARQLNMTEVHAQLLPGDKVEKMETILSAGKAGCTAFCGDGINDAPVLRRADVGVAMGALGSDAAIEAADVVLMDDDPMKLPLAIRIARRTMGIAWQNIVFALGVKAAVMVLGALGMSSMWLAVFADVGVAMLAVMNAMRALRIK